MSEQGTGWAIASLDDMGEGPGFRKVRTTLGVEAFGVNAIVLPPGIETGIHFHEEQDELYFTHRGTIEIDFGDGTWRPLPEGTFAHVASSTHRRIRNTTDADATYVIVGGKGGYVGRDGQRPEGEPRVQPSS